MLHHHHILPRAGGWDDQCELWAEDINNLTARYNRMHARYAIERESARAQSDDDDDLLAAMTDAPSARDFGSRYGLK